MRTFVTDGRTDGQTDGAGFIRTRGNGQYSGQNSLFFPHPEKGGSLFLPCFSRHFYGEIFRLTAFFGKNLRANFSSIEI